jgi:hypothetical protein
MKTPREVLLQRHQSIERRLDDVREHVIATVVEGKGRAGQDSQRARRSSPLREFLLPWRWHLAGMTAVWIVVAVLNIDRPSSASTTQQAAAPPRQLLTELRENRRQILELVESSITQPDAGGAASLPAPPPFVPRRRSELQPACIVV